jgi:hypothetical protein
MKKGKKTSEEKKNKEGSRNLTCEQKNLIWRATTECEDVFGKLGSQTKKKKIVGTNEERKRGVKALKQKDFWYSHVNYMWLITMKAGTTNNNKKEEEDLLLQQTNTEHYITN